MPTISLPEAAERLAKGVEKAKASHVAEIYSELFPEGPSPTPAVASDIAKHVRSGLEPEELVDLWNVVFPDDRHVWYNEEEKEIYYNEEVIGYVD